MTRYYLLLCFAFLRYTRDTDKTPFPSSRDSAHTHPECDPHTDEVFAVVNANHPKLQAARLGIQNADASLQRAWVLSTRSSAHHSLPSVNLINLKAVG